MVLDVLKIAAPLVAAVIAVIGVHSTNVHARESTLSSTYFSEMVSAYNYFFEAVTRFVYHGTLEDRDNLSMSVYRVCLFGTDEICKRANETYWVALEWAKAGRPQNGPVDAYVNEIGDLMRAHLHEFRGRISGK